MSDKLIIPSLDEIKQGIDQILLVENWDRYKIKSSPKRFQKRLHKLFTGKFGVFPTVILPVESSNLPFTFYRLRRFDSKMNTSLISEYSYPPNHVVKFTQRANIPFHPVFYCSNNPATSIFETIKNEKTHSTKDQYYLSEWVFKPGKKLNFSPYIFGNLNKKSPYVKWSDGSFKQLEKSLSRELNQKEIEGLKTILQFLSQLFIYENTYAVSSYIAHEHLYADHSFRSDLFMYPSWHTDRHSLNFAIHPNTVVEKMTLKSVYRMSISDYSEENQSYTARINRFANNQDGILFWKSINEDDKDVNDKFRDFFN